MSVTRRSFLTGLFSVATLAVATPHFATPALAQAYVDKIKHLEFLFDKVVDRNHSYLENKKTEPFDFKIYNEYMEEDATELMAFLANAFKEIELTDRVKAEYLAFAKHEFYNGNFRSIPPTTIEEFIPILVLRELFKNEFIRGTPFITGKAKIHFNKLAKGIHPLIMYEYANIG